IASPASPVWKSALPAVFCSTSSRARRALAVSSSSEANRGTERMASSVIKVVTLAAITSHLTEKRCRAEGACPSAAARAVARFQPMSLRRRKTTDRESARRDSDPALSEQRGDYHEIG